MRASRAAFGSPRVRCLHRLDAWPRTPSGSRISKRASYSVSGSRSRDAAGEHLGRGVVEAEILAENLFAAETEQRHALLSIYPPRASDI